VKLLKIPFSRKPPTHIGFEFCSKLDSPGQDEPFCLGIPRRVLFELLHETLGREQFSCRPNRSGRLECSAMKNKHVWTDRFVGICLVVATFAAVTMTDRAGMPQRWHAAIVGILLPFASIISIKRTSWPRPTFWTSLGGCFVLNFLLIASFFEFVLRGVRVFGWIWWVPVAFVQTLGMLYLQPKLERTLRAR